MTDLFANRNNWLIKVAKLKPLDVLTIHPKDDLKFKEIVAALSAQKILYIRPGVPEFRILDHGTKFLIQKL